MNREYRAWDKEEQKYYYLNDIFNKDIEVIMYLHPNLVRGKGDLVFEQFTPIKDFEGNLWCEGDIWITSGDVDVLKLGEYEYGDDWHYGFYFESVTDNYATPLSKDHGYKIAGNRHEHPHLLKEQS